MACTPLELPDELYARAKQLSEARQMSLDEITRRSLEMYLAAYPADPPKKPWRILTITSGGVKVPLEELHDITADEESMRSLPH